jgi:hypothetical protein
MQVRVQTRLSFHKTTPIQRAIRQRREALNIGDAALTKKSRFHKGKRLPMNVSWYARYE